MIAVSVRVTGRVQGVGFRWHTIRQARRLGVAGWVGNADDGSVHVHLEGGAAAVDEMLAWLQHGPAAAEVEDVEVVESSPTGATGFDVSR